MRVFYLLALACLVVAAAGCSASIVPAGTTPTAASGPATPTVTPSSATASPTTSATLSTTDLKYVLLAQFPNTFFCDPDEYPVAHEVTDDLVASRVNQLKKNTEEYEAILRHLGFSGLSSLTPAQNRLVYGDSKKLNAIEMTPSAEGFSFRLRESEAAKTALSIEGVINPVGVIQVTNQQPTPAMCPICLAGSTLIDTPYGLVTIESMRPGMLVWTADRFGSRKPGVVLRTARRSVPGNALLVHLVLEDGRQLFASGRHPAFGGTPIGDLLAGDMLDGSRVLRIAPSPVPGGGTYDILPSGETGAYWANGILLESTLKENQATPWGVIADFANH